MSDEREGGEATAPGAGETPSAAETALEQGARTVALLRRLVVFLLGVWNVFAGLSLTIFQGATSDSLGAGSADEAAQRLLGVHMLVLAPVFFALAWKPEKYGVFLWLAYLSQAAIAASTAFDLLAGNRDIEDGALPLVVSLIFLVLLVYLWIVGRRPPAERPAEVREEMASPGQPGEDSGPE